MIDEKVKRGLQSLREELREVTGLNDTDKWLSDLEAKQNTARRGRAGASDNWLEALPDDYRHAAEIAERMGHEDAVKSACFGAYWDLHIRLAQQGVRPTPGGANKIAEDLSRLVSGMEGGLSRGRILKSLSEGVSTQGGMTVATPVEAELYRLIRDNSVVRPLATKIVMGGPTVQLPAEGTNVTAYMVPEMAVINTQAVQLTASSFTQIAIVARKMAGIATVSNELLEDNIISLQEYLFTSIAEHIGIIEDTGALDGSTSFTGLDRATGVNSFSTLTTGTTGGNVPYFNELIKMIFYAQHNASRNGARLFLHPYAFKNIMGLVDSTGQPVFMYGNAPGSIPYVVGGFPVSLVSSLSITQAYKTSSTNIYFGPPSKIIFGDIAGMQFDIDPFSRFTEVMTNVRVIKRTGIAIPTPSAFTILHGVKNITNEGSGAPGT